MRKHQWRKCLLPAALLLFGKGFGQYGGYVPQSARDTLCTGSRQEVFMDTTNNNGSIATATKSVVIITGTAANKQHLLLGTSSSYTQADTFVLNNGTGGLLIATATYGLQVVGKLDLGPAASGIVLTPRTSLAKTTNNLRVEATATITNANATHFIDGYLQRIGGTSFTFPVGQGTIYAPFYASSIGTGNSLTIAYFASAHPSTALATSVKSITKLEYWADSVTGSATSSDTISLKLGKTHSTLSGSVIAGLNKSTNKWEAIPTTAPSSVVAGTVIKSAGLVVLANYTAFTIGNTLSASATASIVTPVAAIDKETPPLPIAINAKAYPNPTTGPEIVSVGGDAKKNYTISLADANGKLLITKAVQGQSSQIINLGGFSNGMYFITITDDGNTIIKTIKIIKTK